MKRVLLCECGFLARADDEDGLVGEVRRHARDAHGMELSLEEALLLTFRAGLGTQTPSVSPRAMKAQREER